MCYRNQKRRMNDDQISEAPTRSLAMRRGSNMFTKNKQLLSSEKSFLRGPIEHGSRPSDREGGILTTGSEARVVSEKMKVVEPSFHVVHDTGARKEMVTMVGRGRRREGWLSTAPTARCHHCILVLELGRDVPLVREWGGSDPLVSLELRYLSNVEWYALTPGRCMNHEGYVSSNGRLRY